MMILHFLLYMGILSFMIFLFKKYLTTYVVKRVEHSFNIKLEKIKSDLDQEKKKLERVSSHLLDVSSNHSAIINEQKIKAISELWQEFIAFKHKAKINADILSSLNYQEIKKRWNDPKVSNFLDLNKQYIDTVTDKIPQAKYKENLRIWVSDDVWSCYYTYTILCGYAAARILILKIRDDSFESVSRVKKIIELLNLSITNLNISELNDALIPSYLDILEQKLLCLLKYELSGKDIYQSERLKTSQMIILADEIAKDLDTASKIPDTVDE